MINIEAIAAALETLSCPEHAQHPKVNIEPEGVSIAACCQPFHDQVAARLQQDVESAMEKVMADAMKHLQ